jgi:signal transduction histidine kinase
LLNKLENQEFSAVEPVNFSSHVRSVLDDLSELIAMKSIALKTDIAENVNIILHPSLADILITNLFSNAIRHNFQQGMIYISLTSRRLLVENTGYPPEGNLDRAFERFTRTSQNQDSVGLGLAIAKQICDVGGFQINYEYKADRHLITVTFAG